MSTNIITGFEITNDLTITDGQLQVSTNDVDSSLDISGNITIGVLDNPNKSKLIVKDLSDAEINLLSKSGTNTISHKIINKNGNLKFENNNSNKTNYEFKVDSNSSIGIIKCNNVNESGFIFGKNTSEADGIQTYNNGNITLNNTNRNLMLTSEKITLNISDTNYDTRTESLIVNSSSNIGLRITNPLYRLHIKDDNTASEDVQDLLCLENTGNSIGQAGTGILFRQQYGTNSTTIHNKAKIEVRDASDNGGDFIFYIHEQNENADDTLKELMFLKSDKTVDICGNLNIQSGTFSGIMNGNSLICNNIGILHENPIVELDISGVGAIRIPCGTNENRDDIVLGGLPGYIRFNTTQSQYEGYDGSNWRGLGGVVSLNQDTYIEATDINGLRFIVADSEEMRVASNGNIGIGLIAPTSKLHVDGDTIIEGDLKVTNENDSDYQVFIDMDSTSYARIQTIQQGVGYNQDLAIQPLGGNVGIGTTSPNCALDVVTSGNEAKILIQNDTLALLQLRQPTNNYVWNLEIGRTDGEFSMRNGNGEKVRIKANGNVGIGTTSPTYKLQIYTQGANTMNNDGYANFDNGFYLSGPSNYYGRCFVLENRVAGASHSSRPVLFRNLGGVGEWFAGKAENGCGIVVIDSVGPSDNNSNTASNSYYDSGVSFLVGNNLDNSNRKTNFLIKQNGYVGIGTDSPGEKLTVNGSIQISGSSSSTVTNESKIIFTRDITDTDESENIAKIYTGNNVGPLVLESSRGNGYIKTIGNSAGVNPIFIATHFVDGERFRICGDGRVGIGTNSPEYNLDIRGPGKQIFNVYCTDGTGDAYARFSQNNGSPAGVGGLLYLGASDDFVFLNARFDHPMIFYQNNSESMRIHNNGHIGIGTNTPKARLHVKGSYYNDAWVGSQSRRYFVNSTESTGTTDYGSRHWGFYCEQDALFDYHLFIASDKRIKNNIIEINDDLALQKVRDISCCWYNYIDRVSRGDGRVLGFIAQQVKEHLPEAVTESEHFIPNEMKKIHTSWDGTKMSSNDIPDVSGIRYRFYVGNDISDNEKIIELVGDENNCFTFKEKWENVFCYGKEVDDFHTLDKNKLFALNFSATQELDKKVTVLENKSKLLSEIDNLRETVSKQNNIIADLETKYTNLLSRVTQLELSN